MDDASLEAHLAATAKGPRVSLADVDNCIARAEYWNPKGTTLTICVLHLKNGFTVTGESASASKDNFNRIIGQDLAFQKARDKIWMLEGYRLRSNLHDMGVE